MLCDFFFFRLRGPFEAFSYEITFGRRPLREEGRLAKRCYNHEEVNPTFSLFHAKILT